MSVRRQIIEYLLALVVIGLAAMIALTAADYSLSEMIGNIAARIAASASMGN